MNAERISSDVYLNAAVTKGQYLGQYDYRQNGSSTGPHVHIGRKINGIWVDPGSTSPLKGNHVITSRYGVIDRAHPKPHKGTDYAY